MIEAVHHYAAIRARLNRPANAVRDNGIDLKRKKPLSTHFVVINEFHEIPEKPDSQITISVPKIMRVVAEACGASVKELMSDIKTRRVSKARDVAMYLAHHVGRAPVGRIAWLFGGFDRTTVVKAIKRTSLRLLVDDKLVAEIGVLRMRLESCHQQPMSRS